MKALLGALLCLVLFNSECFAIKGGPIYKTGQVSVTGNYAGVLYPIEGDNSLGIFTVSVPTTGISSGSVFFFRNGNYYPGTIQGLADPDSAQFVGVADATFNISFATVSTTTTGTTTITFVVTYNANGGINAKVVADPNLYSSVTARLNGTADITYTVVGSAPGLDTSPGMSDGPISYIVDGFKQSTL